MPPAIARRHSLAILLVLSSIELLMYVYSMYVRSVLTIDFQAAAEMVLFGGKSNDGEINTVYIFDIGMLCPRFCFRFFFPAELK